MILQTDDVCTFAENKNTLTALRVPDSSTASAIKTAKLKQTND